VIETLARLTTKAEYYALIPGAFGAVIVGSWLVDEGGFSFDEAWLSASYLVWALATAIGLIVLGPHARRVARHAAELRLNGVTESDELQAEAGKPLMGMLGMGQLVLILALLWLMTAKPGA
jgi:uncharacterized membrane protein